MYMLNSWDYNGIVSSDASSIVHLKALLTGLIHTGDSDAFYQPTTSQSWQTLKGTCRVLSRSSAGPWILIPGVWGMEALLSPQVPRWCWWPQAYLVGTTVMGFFPFLLRLFHFVFKVQVQSLCIWKRPKLFWSLWFSLHLFYNHQLLIVLWHLPGFYLILFVLSLQW